MIIVKKCTEGKIIVEVITRFRAGQRKREQKEKRARGQEKEKRKRKIKKIVKRGTIKKYKMMVVMVVPRRWKN